MATLVNLPVELLLMIVDRLSYHDDTDADGFISPQRDLSSFLRTDKRLYSLFQSYLYKANDKCMNQTALAYGAFHGDIALVRRTLEINKSRLVTKIPSWRRRYGLIRHRPICWAAAGGQTAMIEYLLELGVSLGQDSSTSTRCVCETDLLGHAAGNGHLETMKYLVAKGLRFESQREVTPRRRHNISALRMAAENGQGHCFEFILNAESYRNLQGKDYVHRIAYILLAIVGLPASEKHDRIESALYLLKQSRLTEKRDFCRCIVEVANPLTKDMRALNETLAKPGRIELFAEMLLYLAVMSGHLILLDEMVRLGSSVETRYRGAHTPLCLAALEGGPQAAARLLEFGADMNAKNAKDQSPLFLATLSKSFGVMEVLLNHGANVNACSTRCGIVQTPLWRAVADQTHHPHLKRNKNSPVRAGRHSLDGIVKLLLDNGADPNFQDPTYGITPLWLALSSRFKHIGQNTPAEIIEILIKHGADVRIARRKMSLLWEGMHNHTSFTIKLLRLHGADPNDYGDDFDPAKPYRGRQPMSALAKAVKWGRFDVAEALLDTGADPHAQFWKKDTCLVKVASFGPVSLVERLLDGGVDVNETFGGKTALDIAIWNCNEGLKELLLRRGAVQKGTLEKACAASKEPDQS